MAGITARELRAIVETGRSAERAFDQAKASLAALGPVVDDPYFQRELASAAGALHAVDQSDMAKQAAAISVFSGPGVADLTKVAGPVSTHVLKSADVLSHIAEAERYSATVAAEYERHRKAIDEFRPTAAEIAAEHDRHLRLVESMRPTAAEMAAAEDRARWMRAEAERARTEYSARAQMLSNAMKVSMPSTAELAARHAEVFRVSDEAARSARAMFHVVQDAAKSQDALMAASRQAAGYYGIGALGNKRAAIEASMRSVVTPDIDKALKSGFWIVPPDSRAESAFRVTFPYVPRRAPREFPAPFDDEPGADRGASNPDLYVSAPQEIIVPGQEGAKRKRGRPPRRSLSRDELLDRLAAGLATLAKHAQRDATVRVVVLRAGLNLSTVYGHFSDGSFGWQTVPIRWRDVLRLLLLRQATGLTWAELLGGAS